MFAWKVSSLPPTAAKSPRSASGITATMQKDNSNTYPHILKILGVLDYAPYVKTFEVVSSTLQKVVPACQLESEIWLSTKPAI